MQETSAVLCAPLGFTRAEDVLPDEAHPGLFRARTLDYSGESRELIDFRSCPLKDCRDPRTLEPGLEQAGFETVVLSELAALQRTLAAIRAEDRISEESARALRESLRGARLRLARGRSLHVEYIAEEGLIQRRAGPNGLDVNPGGMQGANGHGAALAIHGDQNVFGTPLSQLMNGRAPQLFRHQTRGQRNDAAMLFLLNLWIPIQQITQPLVLMDRRTLDPLRHQLRYGLPVTSFLERDAAQSVNDIWTFLPDPAQEWYFRSAMGPDQGYVFDTLGAPHGACTLPGEEALEALYRKLDRACEAVTSGDRDALRAVCAESPPPLPELTTDPIRAAAAQMSALLREADLRADALLGAGEDWSARARATLDCVIRKSIEMRLVASLHID